MKQLAGTTPRKNDAPRRSSRTHDESRGPASFTTLRSRPRASGGFAGHRFGAGSAAKGFCGSDGEKQSRSCADICADEGKSSAGCLIEGDTIPTACQCIADDGGSSDGGETGSDEGGTESTGSEGDTGEGPAPGAGAGAGAGSTPVTTLRSVQPAPDALRWLPNAPLGPRPRISPRSGR